MIVGGLLAPRPALPERRERRVDQARVERRERLVAEPERLERAGAVVLHEHVRGGCELAQGLAVGLLLQVQRDRALVRRLGQEGGAHLATVERLVGAGAAALVGVVGMLDLDHVGAEHGQLVGGERPGQDVRDVDHADAFERSRHCDSSLRALVDILSHFANSSGAVSCKTLAATAVAISGREAAIAFT